MDQLLCWVSFRLKLDLKEKATTDEIKCEPARMAAEKLFPNESHATANVSLLAHWRKLPTANFIKEVKIRLTSNLNKNHNIPKTNP